jgi:protein-L-isoaspartate(D-aspartate) O-methyltransferase
MDYRAARKHMVDSQVRTSDVTDLRLQAALEDTPREVFLPPPLRPQAYIERDVGYAPGRRLITARDFARLIDALDPNPSDLALDVACGSGYATAVLTRLCEMVVAVERDETLCAKAQENLAEIGADNSAVVTSEPAKGCPTQGPYDAILIASGAIAVEPTALFDQLKEGGRLAAVRREGAVARGVLWRKDGDVVAPRILFDAAVSGVLPEFTAPKRFTF